MPGGINDKMGEEELKAIEEKKAQDTKLLDLIGNGD